MEIIVKTKDKEYSSTGYRLIFHTPSDPHYDKQIYVVILYPSGNRCCVIDERNIVDITLKYPPSWK